MVEYVLTLSELHSNRTIINEEYCDNTRNYANFLKQPLKLEMFVPCDSDGNVLANPNNNMNLKYPKLKHQQYRQAKEKVLFKGATINEYEYYSTKKQL